MSYNDKVTKKNCSKRRRKMEYPKVKRNVLLNPGPATTTDTVKYAQVVPDICPREKEFGAIMKQMGEDLVKIVHGDLDKYTAVLFTGSGTINIDACVNSLVPEGKKILVLNNGAYSGRAAEVARYYHMDHINLELPITEPIDVARRKKPSNPIRISRLYTAATMKPAPAC